MNTTINNNFNSIICNPINDVDVDNSTCDMSITITENANIYINDSCFVDFNISNINSANEMKYRNVLENITQKFFGKLLATKLFQKNIRILISDSGFSIWFPFTYYSTFHIDLHEYLVALPSKTQCWLVNNNYAYIKVDINPDDLIGNDISYADPDMNTRMKKIEEFVTKNFINNKLLFPLLPEQAIGRCLEFPKMPRPIKRNNGDTKIKYRIEF